jgi:hypothetical protein
VERQRRNSVGGINSAFLRFADRAFRTREDLNATYDTTLRRRSIFAQRSFVLGSAFRSYLRLTWRITENQLDQRPHVDLMIAAVTALPCERPIALVGHRRCRVGQLQFDENLVLPISAVTQ